VIRIESTLSRGRGLENALGRKKIGLGSGLSRGQGLENALKMKRDRARKYII
jgi:hypothetical protein